MRAAGYRWPVIQWTWSIGAAYVHNAPELVELKKKEKSKNDDQVELKLAERPPTNKFAISHHSFTI